jgi:hypothetical protein
MLPEGSTTGFMDVEIDDHVIFTVTEADTSAYSSYAEVVLDISEYADGGAHNLEFYSITEPEFGVLNFTVDDVSITTESSEIDWISLVGPTSGTVNPGDSAMLAVRLRAGDLPASYAGSVVISSNDPGFNSQRCSAPSAIVYQHRRGVWVHPLRFCQSECCDA